MPRDRIRVERVDEFVTRKPGVTQFIIEAETDRGFTQQYETVNPYLASLCDRSKDKWIDIVWRDSRFGRQVVDIPIVDLVEPQGVL